MPLYVYACPRCKGEVELQRKIVEMDDPVTCMTCKEEWNDVDVVQRRPLMDRVMTAPAPHFPGASSWRG